MVFLLNRAGNGQYILRIPDAPFDHLVHRHSISCQRLALAPVSFPVTRTFDPEITLPDTFQIVTSRFLSMIFTQPEVQ
ncbi:hypothetical protein ACE103_14655 [Bradyrhizobium sp. ma5]|uniref:hypothetical protein n=1 Tax=Bradyrhizobium sp. ma5 TaxID=3344828 RepID=UPI0035D4E021